MSKKRRHERSARPADRATRAKSTADRPSSTAPSSGQGAIPWWWTPAVAFALVALNVAVFASLRYADFVRLDDPWYVTENAHVLAGLTWQNVMWALTTGYEYYWHPLTWLSHMLDVALYGLNAGGHHVTNLIVHVGTTVLLFGLFRRVTGALGPSAFVAALFAVHPLHVEAVAWVAERKEVLGGFFWVLTLWAYVAYVRQPRVGRYLLVALCFVLGLASKPMIVTLPVILLLFDVWPLGRFDRTQVSGLRTRGPGAGNDRRGNAGWLSERWRIARRLAWEKVPLFALAAASSVVTFVDQFRAGAVRGGNFPAGFRVANALVSYVAYIRDTIWPSDLAAYYPYPRSLSGWGVVAAGMALAAVSLIAVRAAKRCPYLFVGWFWYLVTLLPVIGLVQVGDQARADRFMYVPLVGLLLMVAWGIPDLLARWPARRVVLPAAAGLAVVAAAVTAHAQVQYWQDNEALWERAAAVTADNQRAEANLGAIRATQGRIDEAVAHYAEAARIVPRDPDLRQRMAQLLLRQGRVAEAIEQMAVAVRLAPNDASIHISLGMALSQQGRLDDAVREFTEAVRLEPRQPQAHNSLGVALERLDRTADAAAEYAEAVRLRPDYAAAHHNLGVALAKLGRLDEGIAAGLEALRLDPRQADWHYDVAVTFEQKGDVQEAVRHLEAALQIAPDHGPARRALEALGKRGRN